MTRLASCVVLVGALCVNGVVVAQDARGDPEEVAVELAAAAAWEASPAVAGAPAAVPTSGTQGTTILPSFDTDDVGRARARGWEIIYSSNFDTDNGGLTGTRDWEWGTSYAWTGVGCFNTAYHQPPAPHSGVGMWGTVLNTCYNNLGNNQGAGSGTCTNTNPGDDSILTLTVDLTNYAWAALDWKEWYDVFSYSDWTEVRVNDTSVSAYCPPSYGVPGGWTMREVGLPFVGGVVTVEWHFMASTVVNYAGWYIDDVVVWGAPVPVELQSFTAE